MKKFFSKSIYLFIIIILISNLSFADDYIEDDFESENLDYVETSTPIENVPEINAKHAIILDRASKQILYGKKENEKCKMASTTKIMTAIIVIENANLNDIVTISSNSAQTGGSTLGLSKNDTITVENLLYGLMLRSGNDAAVALAEHISGNIEAFANLMNQKAYSLSLFSTHFITPHGLDKDEHYTTAHDLALLTDYALQNETFLKIVRTKNYTISINGYPKSLSNTNELLGNLPGIYGVKTGFTNGANRCLVTACKRGDLDIICVVLGCDTKTFRTQDSIKLINYIFNNFILVNIHTFITNEFDAWKLLHSNYFTISKGTTQIVTLELDKNIPYSYMAINKKDINNINIQILANSFYSAPLYSNTLIGKLAFRINDNEFFSLDIVNKNEVQKKNIFYYLSFIFLNYINFFKSGT